VHDRAGTDAQFVMAVETSPWASLFFVRGAAGNHSQVEKHPSSGDQLQIQVAEIHSRLVEEQVALPATADQHERLLKDECFGRRAGSRAADGERNRLSASTRFEEGLERFAQGPHRLGNRQGGLAHLAGGALPVRVHD
jgi:hypothetical protein